MYWSGSRNEYLGAGEETTTVLFVCLDDWFLTAEERGNDASGIDQRASKRQAWTEGNQLRVLVDGSTYFSRLIAVCDSLGEGDQLRFTDWRGDGDEMMQEGGPSIAQLVSDSSRRGVDVRVLLWRSHSDRLAFSAKENRRLAAEVAAAGGEAVLDNRVRRGGSHHQKLVIARRAAAPEQDVAFVGGIDLSHGRRDDRAHRGDQQSVEMNPRYGERPPWHDVQLEIRGPAVADLDFTFQERWRDPTPLNHSGLARAWSSRLLKQDRVGTPLAEPFAPPPPKGDAAVQVLRTYPKRHPRYPFAPDGERSIARAFAKAVARARTLIYIEDQYLWSTDVAHILASALRRHPKLQLIVVLPRFPDKDGRFSGPPARLAQSRVLEILRQAGGDRVGVYDLENSSGSPVYVHAKVCVIDDVWVSVGSDNLNRRSWTHDSEVSCAVIDSHIDTRAPQDPGGLGDLSRSFARDVRLRLWAEHLWREIDDPALVPLKGAVRFWDSLTQQTAPGGHENKDIGKTSHLRIHEVEPVNGLTRLWAEVLYRLLFDPDGRPLSLRLRRHF